jgi:hypothetical protein
MAFDKKIDNNCENVEGVEHLAFVEWKGIKRILERNTVEMIPVKHYLEFRRQIQ